MAATIPTDKITIPASWQGKAPILIAVGAVSILLSLALFSISGSGEASKSGFSAFFHSYLANYMFCLSFCLGALFFVMLQHLVRACWSASIRRIAELLACTIPRWSLMFIPILIMVLGYDSGALYRWNEGVESDQLSQIVINKIPYFLNPGFFTLRTIIYFAVFILTARWYFTMSRKQDETGDTGLTLRMQRWAGPGIILFSLSLNFASFDWMMSTDADWFSTIYGVYLFSASMLSFFAVMILSCYVLQRNGRAEKLITKEHYHDLAMFQFGFIVFWAYIAFSQYLLYWYGNIPEETVWYKERTESGWQWVGMLLITLHFVLPFLGTMSRHVRRNKSIMAGWAAFILFVHWLDMMYLILPNVGPLTTLMVLGHLVCWIGMVCVFLAFLIHRVGETPIVAIKDPWLPEALAYHNI